MEPSRAPASPASLIRDCKVFVFGVRDATVESALRAAPDHTRVIIDLVGIPDPSAIPGEYHGSLLVTRCPWPGTIGLQSRRILKRRRPKCWERAELQ
jgi:hypothetical protein